MLIAKFLIRGCIDCPFKYVHWNEGVYYGPRSIPNDKLHADDGLYKCFQTELPIETDIETFPDWCPLISL